MKYITYLRVSTTKQSLGIDAQRALVKSHIQDQQGEHFAEFIEKEREEMKKSSRRKK